MWFKPVKTLHFGDEDISLNTEHSGYILSSGSAFRKCCYFEAVRLKIWSPRGNFPLACCTDCEFLFVSYISFPSVLNCLYKYFSKRKEDCHKLSNCAFYCQPHLNCQNAR